MQLSSIDWSKWLAIAVSVATIVNVGAVIWLGILSRSVQKQQTEIQRQVAKIQKQQAETNARQFRLDLFEKRMAVFASTTEFLAHVTRTAKAELPHLFDLLEKTRNHEFLFGREIAEFIDEVYKREGDLNTRHTFPPAERNISEEKEILTWFARQLRDAERVFLPYMDFRQP